MGMIGRRTDTGAGARVWTHRLARAREAAAWLRILHACAPLLALCAALAAGAAASGPAAAPLAARAAADPFGRLAAWAREAVAQDAAPSLAVAVARDGRIAWAEAFGWADREHRVPATPHTRYSLASVSKPVTATGLMLLVERGLVDLDRPIDDYLGDTPLAARLGPAEGATVRRVANHTAGLPVHHHFFIVGQRAPPPMEETIRRYGQIVLPPGERFQYSNLGYGLIGHAIARRTGRAFDAFMRDELFRPLGLTRTTVGLPPEARGEAAVRYGRDGRPLPDYTFDHDGASAVFSTAYDLARFGLLHVGRPGPGTPRLLSEAAVRAMQRPGPGTRDGAAQYGLGWQIRGEGRGRVVSHGGGMPGVSTLLTLVPDARLVVVALANASSPLPWQFTERALAELAPAAHRTMASGPVRAALPRPRGRPPRELAGAWAGAVHGGGITVPLRLRVGERGEVAVRLGDAPEAPLAPAVFLRRELRGLLRGVPLPTEDAARAEALHLALVLRGSVLAGTLTAVKSSDEEPGFALAHWVALDREPAQTGGEPNGPPALGLRMTAGSRGSAPCGCRPARIRVMPGPARLPPPSTRINVVARGAPGTPAPRSRGPRKAVRERVTGEGPATHRNRVASHGARAGAGPGEAWS